MSEEKKLTAREAAEMLRATDEVKRETRELRTALSATERELGQMRKQLDLFVRLEDARLTPPAWSAPRKDDGDHHAIVCLQITDPHFDEIVRPEEIEWINKYDRKIAAQRLKRVFEKTIALSRDYLSGVKYDGCYVFFTGDMFSGNIHEELKETNVSTLFDAIVHWADPVEAGLSMLADHFGKVFWSGVVGNHGRMTRKPRAKFAAQDNVDWLFYRMIQRDFEKAKDTRITSHVPNSPDTIVPVYDTRYLLTHGDQFKGGSGISGAMAPLLLGTHRKSRRQLAAGKPYTHMVFGHFHQYLMLPSKGLIGGGALKGYDEYAFQKNFEPEPAQASFWITTPEHGVGFALPVIAQDRKAEGW
jgi:hypothetical protein